MAVPPLNRSPSDSESYVTVGRRYSLQEYKQYKDEDWKVVQNSLTRLFQTGKLTEMNQDLPALHERISKLSNSDLGQFLPEFFQKHALNKCMIILRHDLKECKGLELIEKLEDVWVLFYTQLLPIVEAIFAPTEFYGQIRSIALTSFRDHVLLRTAIEDTVGDVQLSPRFRQMLLVLQSIVDSPPSKQFQQLIKILNKALDPYICLTSLNVSEK